MRKIKFENCFVSMQNEKCFESKLKALCTLCRFLSLILNGYFLKRFPVPSRIRTKSELILSENSDRRQSRTVSRCCNFRNNFVYMRRKLRYYKLVNSLNSRNNRVSRIEWTNNRKSQNLRTRIRIRKKSPSLLAQNYFKSM